METLNVVHQWGVMGCPESVCCQFWHCAAFPALVLLFESHVNGQLNYELPQLNHLECQTDRQSEIYKRSPHNSFVS